MARKAGSERKRKGCLWVSLKYFGIFLFLYVILNVWIRIDMRAKCVVLPNGYMIGRAGVFQQGDRPFTYTVLRDARGKILITTDKMIQFHRHPTNSDLVILEYGKKPEQRMEMPGHEMMTLIFDSKFFKRKWNEKKKEYPLDTAIIATSFYTVFLELRRSPKFKTVSCNTPWFAP